MLQLQQICWHTSRLPQNASIVRTSVHQTSVRNMAGWNPFSRKKKNKDMYEEEAESEEMVQYRKELDSLTKEVRDEYIQSRRNKSRLSASDRQILHGKPPYTGITFQYVDSQRLPKFRRPMFGRYGAKKTGINPGELWPTKRDVELAKEWESLYQPKSLHEMMEDIHREREAKETTKQRREELIDANLEKHENLVAAWQNRIQAKTRLEENAKNRRARVLAELKEEFGYEVNPNDEIMSTKIQEREKVLIKEERELKRKLKMEKQKEMEKENASK
eukprot:TRINITY_DN1296_c0_g1_i3.p1 TRINITY_DN1296_c0_g1~~TRINITY_DN1296_c0_g1_i3.p1  ORF type:complete len:275 (-),score=68.69 TRINITY_DN1296_c0_g1_i3:139-963(-)